MSGISTTNDVVCDLEGRAGWPPGKQVTEDVIDLVTELGRREDVSIYGIDMEDLDGIQQYVLLFRDLFKLAKMEQKPRRVRVERTESDQDLSLSFEFNKERFSWTFDHYPGRVSEPFLGQAVEFLKPKAGGQLHCLLTDDDYGYVVLLRDPNEHG
ncbi:hypothetical protein CF392_15130 [Tamilnaduibacter salinus]|uniref:Uncharacterized protein n=1 Tax=Tamilnaduibacter salinus TaxID=1484056 RepID=A0A2A2HZS6_9GAMM|nr:hypothetical protein [Tamilnaduibacter salinus]PAV24648.1 hypothetical protein CF392_15130 [Tamilnaduibacter salinus]